MRKLIIAMLVALPGLASAQHAEVEPGPGGTEGHAQHADGEHGGGHGDPSKHFNWTGNPMPFGSDSYKAFDAEGGPIGDGKMGIRPLTEGEEEEPMSVPFIFVLINFGLLLILLGKKGGPIAQQMASKRSDEIKNALEEATRLRNAAKDKLDEYTSKLRAAESEMDQMIKTMKESAESEKARIIAAAEQQAALLKKDAEDRIAAEIERARQTLQREVVLAATEVAERTLRDKTTKDDQAKLVENFLQQVAPS